MFENNYNTPYNFNSMPTATQPYGYPMFNTPMAQNNIPRQTNTNKIYVNGIDDVRSKTLPFDSDFLFLDNDKPLLYQKIVDNKGQFEVKAFQITPYSPTESEKRKYDIDLDNYVKKCDLEPILSQIKDLEIKITKKDGVVIDGTTSQ